MRKFIILVGFYGYEVDTYKFFLLTTMFNTDMGLATLVKHLEWEILEIGLDYCVIEVAPNKTFYIKNTKDYANK